LTHALGRSPSDFILDSYRAPVPAASRSLRISGDDMVFAGE
jgi:hypothetical protein